jgi:DNA-binding response OmpR family regulator
MRKHPLPVRGNQSLLFIEDFDRLRLALEQHFEKRGYRIYSATRSTDAEALAHSILPQAIFLDYDLAADDAVTVAKQLRTILPGSIIIITGGPNNAIVRSRIEAAGNIRYQPFIHELVTIDQLLEQFPV